MTMISSNHGVPGRDDDDHGVPGRDDDDHGVSGMS